MRPAEFYARRRSQLAKATLAKGVRQGTGSGTSVWGSKTTHKSQMSGPPGSLASTIVSGLTRVTIACEPAASKVFEWGKICAGAASKAIGYLTSTSGLNHVARSLPSMSPKLSSVPISSYDQDEITKIRDPATHFEEVVSDVLRERHKIAAFYLFVSLTLVFAVTSGHLYQAVHSLCSSALSLVSFILSDTFSILINVRTLGFTGVIASFFVMVTGFFASIAVICTRALWSILSYSGMYYTIPIFGALLILMASQRDILTGFYPTSDEPKSWSFQISSVILSHAVSSLFIHNFLFRFWRSDGGRMTYADLTSGSRHRIISDAYVYLAVYAFLFGLWQGLSYFYRRNFATPHSFKQKKVMSGRSVMVTVIMRATEAAGTLDAVKFAVVFVFVYPIFSQVFRGVVYYTLSLVGMKVQNSAEILANMNYRSYFLFVLRLLACSHVSVFVWSLQREMLHVVSTKILEVASISRSPVTFVSSGLEDRQRLHVQQLAALEIYHGIQDAGPLQKPVFQEFPGWKILTKKLSIQIAELTAGMMSTHVRTCSQHLPAQPESRRQTQDSPLHQKLYSFFTKWKWMMSLMKLDLEADAVFCRFVCQAWCIEVVTSLLMTDKDVDLNAKINSDLAMWVQILTECYVAVDAQYKVIARSGPQEFLCWSDPRTLLRTQKPLATFTLGSAALSPVVTTSDVGEEQVEVVRTLSSWHAGIIQHVHKVLQTSLKNIVVRHRHNIKPSVSLPRHVSLALRPFLEASEE